MISEPLLKCPRCAKGLAQRVAPLSTAEQLLGVLLMQPFRCQTCDHRFLASRLGTLYRAAKAERRQFDRIPVRFSSSLSGSHLRGEGQVLNLSKGGCKIETDLDVQVGTLLYLQLYLAEGEPPVEVAGSVRSSRSGKVGIKFLRVAREQDRLSHFIDLRAERYGRAR